MDIIEASGTGVAFPSSTTYLARNIAAALHRLRARLRALGARTSTIAAVQRSNGRLMLQDMQNQRCGAQ